MKLQVAVDLFPPLWSSGQDDIQVECLLEAVLFLINVWPASCTRCVLLGPRILDSLDMNYERNFDRETMCGVKKREEQEKETTSRK